jgi:hypothetical protein
METDAKNRDHPCKAELDQELDDALKGTFPASDPVAVGDVTSTEPDRPVDRKPALLDKKLVHQLADHLKQKSATGDALLRRRLGTASVLAVLLGFLGWAVWFMIRTWNLVESEMGVHQWIAMILGVFFSFLLGFGLMSLMFFSRRRGYDEPPIFGRQNDDEPGTKFEQQ